MGTLKKKSICCLMNGLDKFEYKNDVVKNTDFKDFETFLKQYLNTADKKQRRKLSEEFRKRHMELHTFLKENADLINAEAEITNIVNNIMMGNSASQTDEQLSNLIKMIEISSEDRK